MAVVPKLAISLLRAITLFATSIGAEEFLKNSYTKTPGLDMAQLHAVYNPAAVLAELAAETQAHSANMEALTAAEADAAALAAIVLDDDATAQEIAVHNAAVTEANDTVTAARVAVTTSRKVVKDLKKDLEQAMTAVDNATQRSQQHNLARLNRATTLNSKATELIKLHGAEFYILVTGGSEIGNEAADGSILLKTVINSIEARIVAEREEHGKFFTLNSRLTMLIEKWMEEHRTFHQGSGDAVAELVAQVTTFLQLVKDLSEVHGPLIIQQLAMRESVVHALSNFTDNFGSSNIADSCSDLLPGAILGEWLSAVHSRVAMLAGKSGVPPRPTKLLAAAAGAVDKIGGTAANTRTRTPAALMETYIGQYLQGQHRIDCPAHPGKGHSFHECDAAFFHAAEAICLPANRKFVKDHLEPNRAARSAARKKALPAPKAENIA